MTHAVQIMPCWQVFFGKSRLWHFSASVEVLIDFGSVHHQLTHILKKVGRVWIFVSVTVSVVHAVQDAIRAGNQVGGALRKPGHYINDSFDRFAGNIHAMRHIPVQEKGVEKQR